MPGEGSSASGGVEVDYVTDLEGNLEYFQRWVARSKALNYDAQGELQLTSGAQFVYGGDVMDRLDGGLRLAAQLVSLKKREPDRVHLIAGNRDLNKLRFAAELAASDLARPATTIPRPHWNSSAPLLAEYLATHGLEDSRTSRLRYYLEHTLGCPQTFEGRRTEIAVLNHRLSVTDGQVTDSLASDAQPGGILWDYLCLAQIAAIPGGGNTIFVHGALDANAIGLVPADETRFCLPEAPQPMRRVEGGVHAWVSEMNALLRRGLDAHVASPEWCDGRRTRGGEVLVALQNRCALWGRCVVSGCYADGGVIRSARSIAERVAVMRAGVTDPLAFERYITDAADPIVAEWLRAGGIRRVVVGHKPSGCSPAVLSSASTGVEVVSADTSYADPSAADGRGRSLACVTIRGPSLSVNRLVVHGVLSDGREHCAALPLLASEPGVEAAAGDGDRHIGTELPGGWWVKARVTEPCGSADGGATYVCCRPVGESLGRVLEHSDANLPRQRPDVGRPLVRGA
jgi:hypothetical protein